ncbi:hypothetical protein ULMS_16720 [Patiriisocius marinistellae]|uniref:Uncharacterized protein n=1 Tax=Patiriisocius marinistellae TaxID=2494560 RepID=A0A5J4FYA2_9FLAO|nr:hypothetical protein [Patiriisocius marinistellae]GEQ86164.1 hypothetical protein ULMS_16720 [Patiriisocius marinistellae]
MSLEHNPIAQLVTQIQNKWNNEVTPYPHLKLVRWLIIPEQARLYEGFLRLESTASGNLPDMVLVLLTPFTSTLHHSKNLIKHWIDAYKNDTETLKELKAKDKDYKWDTDVYEAKISEDTEKNNLLLIDMLRDFQKLLPEVDRPLTFTLFPYSVEDPKEYGRWLNTMIELGLPKHVRFMVFDYADERHLDIAMKEVEDIGKSLSVPLDLDGAISKIATSGDPNKPEVQFRICVSKMTKAVNNNNRENVHKWGKKAIEAAQRSGVNSFFASAHLVYAGMLFEFKEFEIINELLQKALTLATQGLKAGDDTCKPLLIQIYGFQASAKQLEKKLEDAATLFCKQADTALEHGYPQQPLTAWWMAYNAIKKKDKKKYNTIVEKAYQFGSQQEIETLQSTCMTFIAADYYNILDKQNNTAHCKEIDTFMITVDGEDWRSQVETKRKEMEKRKLSLFNWF